MTVDCPECGGEGVVVPRREWEPALCTLCGGKGWITLARYQVWKAEKAWERVMGKPKKAGRRRGVKKRQEVSEEWCAVKCTGPGSSRVR